jgi:hypothetical protein
MAFNTSIKISRPAVISSIHRLQGSPGMGVSEARMCGVSFRMATSSKKSSVLGLPRGMYLHTMAASSSMGIDALLSKLIRTIGGETRGLGRDFFLICKRSRLTALRLLGSKASFTSV